MKDYTEADTESVRIVTDSVACLPQPLVERYGIHIIPVRVTAAGKVYRDTEEELDSQRIRDLQQTSAIDTTPWSPDVYCREYLEAGRSASALVHVVAFSQFTSTISLARAGAAMAQESRPGLRVEVFDSATTGIAQGFIALAAARASVAGGSIIRALAAAEFVRSGIKSAFTLDTLHYLARTGRVPRLTAWASAVLNVKPVIELSRGRERPVALVRSRAQGTRRLLEFVRDSANDGKTLHVALMASDRIQESEGLQDSLEQLLHPAESLVVRASPVTQIVAGPGLLGVAFYRGD
jgi:DegV family protein with EDD domain